MIPFRNLDIKVEINVCCMDSTTHAKNTLMCCDIFLKRRLIHWCVVKVANLKTHKVTIFTVVFCLYICCRTKTNFVFLENMKLQNFYIAHSILHTLFVCKFFAQCIILCLIFGQSFNMEFFTILFFLHQQVYCLIKYLLYNNTNKTINGDWYVRVNAKLVVMERM